MHFWKKLLFLALIGLILYHSNISLSNGVNNATSFPNNQNKRGMISSFSLNSPNVSIINRIGVGPQPTGIIYDFNNSYIYVLSNNSHDVYVINSGANVIGTSIQLGINCSQLTYDPVNGYIYASNDNGNYIVTINTLTNSINGTISTGVYTSDRGVFYNSYNQFLYVEASKQNDLVILNTITQRIVSVIPMTTGFSSGQISMDLHNNMYIPNALNSITIIDSENNSIIKTLSVGAFPLTTLYDSYTGFIYISVDNSLNAPFSNSTNSILVYDPISNRVITNIGVGIGPVSATYDATDDVVFEVNNWTGTLGIINGTTNILEANITIGSDPVAIIYDDFNAQLYIVQAGTDSIIQLDTPSLLHALNSNSSAPNTQDSNNTGNLLVITFVVVLLVIFISIGTYYYYKSKVKRNNNTDMSLMHIEDFFKKKVLLEYFYGRLSVVLNKIQQLTTTIPGQTFLIQPQPSDMSTDRETFLNTRLGIHGQNLVKDMTGLSVLILLEFADLYPQTTTLTAVTQALNKPKTTVKLHIDKLIKLDYLIEKTLIDPEHLDRRYKDLSITEHGISFLYTLKQEIESTLTASS